MEVKTTVVARIDDQGDRVLLYSSAYGRERDYHIIAKKNCSVKVGETIQYEPYGINFGFHIEEEKRAK